MYYKTVAGIGIKCQLFCFVEIFPGRRDQNIHLTSIDCVVKNRVQDFACAELDNDTLTICRPGFLRNLFDCWAPRIFLAFMVTNIPEISLERPWINEDSIFSSGDVSILVLPLSRDAYSPKQKRAVTLPSKISPKMPVFVLS